MKKIKVKLEFEHEFNPNNARVFEQNDITALIDKLFTDLGYEFKHIEEFKQAKEVLFTATILQNEFVPLTNKRFIAFLKWKLGLEWYDLIEMMHDEARLMRVVDLPYEDRLTCKALIQAIGAPPELLEEYVEEIRSDKEFFASVFPPPSSEVLHRKYGGTS